ncbi:hypothetical protein ABZP36_007533 [Zizania latifolia]
MGDAAIAIMEEGKEHEHVFQSRFPLVAVPDGITVPEFMLEGTDAYADMVALVEAVPGGRSYMYGEVVRDTARFARALRSMGIRKGHVIMVVLPSLAVYPVVSLGVMSTGAVFFDVNLRALTAVIKKQVEDSEAKLVVANKGTYDKVIDVGMPVIGIGDQERMRGRSARTSCLPPRTAPVVTLGLLPFFHIYGNTGICCAMLRHKGMVVVMDRFDLRPFLQAQTSNAHRHRVMFAPLVPPVILAMVKSPVAEEFDLSSLVLKSSMTAAAPLAPDLLAAFQRKFPGVQILEAYGLT